MSDRPSALRSTLVVSATRAVAAAFTLAQGILSARAFGTSHEKDAFVVAQSVPTMVTTYLIGGIYASLFVTLTAVDQREGARGMRRYFGRVMLTFALALLPALLLVEAWPGAVVRVMAPGLLPETAGLAATLLRVTTVTAILSLGFSAVSVLFHSRSLFTGPALANLAPSAATLVLLLCCVSSVGIHALTLGPLAGTLLSLVALGMLSARHLRDPTGFVAPPPDPAQAARDRRAFWIAFLPMSLGANFGPINAAVDNAFASYLPTGSITMLQFAFVIVANAQLLTAATVAEVTFPLLTRSILAQPAEVRTVFRSQLRHMFMVTAPIAAGALAFATPLVRALYERGAFTPEATLGVARLLRAYAPSAVFLGFLTLFSLFLIAQRRFAFVAIAAGSMIGANALVDWILIRQFGVVGIALGTNLVAVLHAAILAVVVRRMLGGIMVRGDGSFLLRVGAAAAGMGAIVFLAATGWERTLGTESVGLRLAEAGAGLLLGGLAYAGLLIAFRVEEARTVLRRLFRRLRPAPIRPGA